MGQDIHCVIERHDGKRWAFNRPFMRGERNYSLFRVIHDLTDLLRRNDPNQAPSGLFGHRVRLPLDIDPSSNPDYPDPSIGHQPDDFGEHSRGWLTLSELRAYDGWDSADPVHPTFGMTRRAACHRFDAWMESEPLDAGDRVRIVFGFDS